MKSSPRTIMSLTSIAVLFGVLSCSPGGASGTSGNRSIGAKEGEEEAGAGAEKADGDGSQSNQLEETFNPSVKEFVALRTSILARAGKLNRERDRRSKLLLELGGDIGVGCVRGLEVKSIELVLTGSARPDADVSSKYQGFCGATTIKKGGKTEGVNTDCAVGKRLPTQVPNDSTFDFKLSDAAGSHVLTFSNNEIANQIFANGASFKPKTFNGKGFQIGFFDRLIITKKNISYKSQSRCTGNIKGSSGMDDWDSSCGTAIQVMETRRYSLTSVAVRINGIDVYEGQVNHNFAKETITGEAGSTGQEWTDNKVQLNEGFLRAMQKEDCSGL